jgi:hypothetical protein
VDDPDYELLAYVGRGCDTERGARPERPDRRPAVRDLEEDVDDLEEPVGDITRFDGCLYTVGAQSRSGYAFLDRDGRGGTHSALSFDLEGPGVAQLQLLAFPGEEPPQIECNEDDADEEDDD